MSGRTYWFSDRIGVDYDPDEDENRYRVMDRAEANLIGSFAESNSAWGEVEPGDQGAWHLPALDIDLPCWLRETETPGHFHLLIDKPVRWDDYCELLDLLARFGIVEEGYVRASKERGQTFLALHPWKGETHATERDNAEDVGTG